MAKKRPFVRTKGLLNNSYKRLLTNLIFLKQNANKIKFKINLAIRSYMDFNFEKFKESSELVRLICGLENASHLVTKSQHYHYTNWGGTVTKEDIGNLNIILKEIHVFQKECRTYRSWFSTNV